MVVGRWDWVYFGSGAEFDGGVESSQAEGDGVGVF